jgi:hypothetical protein
MANKEQIKAWAEREVERRRNRDCDTLQIVILVQKNQMKSSVTAQSGTGISSALREISGCLVHVMQMSSLVPTTLMQNS